MILADQLSLFLGAALLLGLTAQALVRSGWTTACRWEAKMSGYAAARHVLDGSGLYDITIEQVPGHLSDYYDRSEKTLRLSTQVYHGRSLAAVGISTHEAGHAIQDATGFRPILIRQIAVPASSFGSGAGIVVAGLGLILQVPELLGLGAILFTTAVAIQLVNLPVEFDASARARNSLVSLGIVDEKDLRPLRRALNAGSLTLLAGTLQSVLTLIHRVMALFQPR